MNHRLPGLANTLDIVRKRIQQIREEIRTGKRENAQWLFMMP